MLFFGGLRVGYQIFISQFFEAIIINLYHHRHPKGSMYGIFTYIYNKNQPNVGKYTSPMDGIGMDFVQKSQVPSTFCHKK